MQHAGHCDGIVKKVVITHAWPPLMSTIPATPVSRPKSVCNTKADNKCLHQVHLAKAKLDCMGDTQTAYLKGWIQKQDPEDARKQHRRTLQARLSVAN